VKTWFQAFAFKWGNLYRYSTDGDDRLTRREFKILISRISNFERHHNGDESGGAGHVELCLTHSLKATGFKPLPTLAYQSWFQNVPFKFNLRRYRADATACWRRRRCRTTCSWRRS
jgi:hypothetical protein